MVKDILQDFFGLTESDSKDVAKSASEWVEELVNEAINKNCDYFSTKGYRYDNGKLTEKYEKEYVDGKCTKDEHYSVDTSKKENKSVANGEKCLRDSKIFLAKQKKDKELEELRKENATLRSQIAEMTTYIDGVNDKIKKAELEKAELQSVVDRIKNCL